jgi:hypothetical protein
MKWGGCGCSLGGFWLTASRGRSVSGSLHGGCVRLSGLGAAGCRKGGIGGSHEGRPRSMLGRSEVSLPAEATTDALSISLCLARFSVFNLLDDGCI